MRLLVILISMVEAEIQFKALNVIDISDGELGYTLTGYTFRSITVPSYTICWLECNEDDRCTSLNFDMSTATCQLNNKTKNEQPGRFESNKNSVYAAWKIPAQIATPSKFVSAQSGWSDWGTARDNCQAISKRLPVILSEAENSAAFANLWPGPDERDIWIGLHEDASGNLVWLDGNAPVYTNWDSNPGSGGCTKLVYGGTWQLVPCNYNNRYHCV